MYLIIHLHKRNKGKNIYNYITELSGMEETWYLSPKGRITLKSFLFRTLFAVTVFLFFYIIYSSYALPKYHEKLRPDSFGNMVIFDEFFESTFNMYQNFTFTFLPLILGLFVLIQAVKRIHDTNRSGWNVLIPVYNLMLIFSKGTVGSNDFGADPKPMKKVKYFDELI